MNIVLWVLQVLLALHTLMGAVWKVSNSEQTVPVLSAIPHGGWLALIGVEVLCAVGLVLPAFTTLGVLAPVSAGVVALEMLGFTVVARATGDTSAEVKGQVTYWLVVLVWCTLVVLGRTLLVPL